ncbi:MAG: hypothetical protein JSS59_10185 [Proteobacteria bacterium]|uniref:hypothetical protein n=1 Tax=Rudaea sp. TaxID=2136325 RepID=UPI00378473D8|nr:hypothetical protein [Pseudomonadota bacterium]
MSADAAADTGEVARRRLHGLIERLRADAAGFDYEQLRRRLVLFFRQSEPVDAESLADGALDRLARRLDEGTVIDNAALYAFGIAKLMLFEARERRTRHEAVRQEAIAAVEDEVDEVESTDPLLLAALRACLREFGARGTELMLAYYRDDDARRIATRRDLAARLGVSMNALRNRALRLREALEACVRRRTQGVAPDRRRDGTGRTDTLDHDNNPKPR